MDILQYIVVYGVPLDTASGGTRLQNYLFNALENHAPVHRYVVTSLSESRNLVDTLATELAQSSDADADGVGNPRRDDVAALPTGNLRTVIIIDGIALLWCGLDVLSQLQSLSQIASVAALVHYPFSEPAYEHEPWLQTLLAKVSCGCDSIRDSSAPSRTATLRSYEASLLRTFDFIIAVGPACTARLATPAFGVASSRIYELDAPLNPVVYSMPLPRPQIPIAPTNDCADYQKICLVAVGSVCPRKDQLTLIRALTRVGARRRSGQPLHLALTIVGDLQCDPSYAEDCAELVASIPYLCGDIFPATSAHNGCSSTSFSSDHDESIEVSDVGKNLDNTHGTTTLSSTCNKSSLKGWRHQPRDSGSGSCRVSVELVGALPQSDALATVASSHGFLFASRFESFGLAPIEAAALGVPVCSTQVGALPSRLCPASTVWVEDSEYHVDQVNESGSPGGSEESKGVEIASSATEHIELEETAAAEKRCQAWVRALDVFLEMLTQCDGAAFRAAWQNALVQRTGIEKSTGSHFGTSKNASISSLEHEAARLHDFIRS